MPTYARRRAYEGVLLIELDGSPGADRLCDALAADDDLPQVRTRQASNGPAWTAPEIVCGVLPFGPVDGGLDAMRMIRADGFAGPLVMYAHCGTSRQLVSAALREGAQDVLFPANDPPSLMSRVVGHALARSAVRQSANDEEAWRAVLAEHALPFEELAHVGSWQVDLRSWNVQWSPEFRRILGLGPADPPLRVDQYALHVHSEDRERVTRELLRLFQHGEGFDSEHRLERDGKEVSVHAIGRCLRGADGRPMHAFGTTQEITARKRIELRLAELSVRDPLTELYNRRGFIARGRERLDRANAQNVELSCLFIEIQGIDRINRSAGFAEGDRALRAFADILRHVIRDPDVVARLDGASFAALATEDAHGPSLLRDRILDAIRMRNVQQSADNQLTANIGRSLSDPCRRDDPATLLDEADTNMQDVRRRAQPPAKRSP